jgi:hypothetical protein
MEEKVNVGTPPAVLLPAKDYMFQIDEPYYVLEIPRKGRYHDLDPEFFAEDAGEFEIYSESNGILFMPAVTKVLFATKKYPDLKFNQFFVIVSFHVERETVAIVGQVVSMMIPVNKKGD